MKFKPGIISRNHKRNGSGLLIIAIVSAVIVSMTALSVAKVNQLAFSGTVSNKIALQAQQYAVSKAELVRTEKYSNLATQNKVPIPNSDSFYDEVKVADESIYPYNANVKQRLCTINVYKDNETLPRVILKVVRLSVDSDSDDVPNGVILAWYGSLSDIPSGYVLCDGRNGTPDLRDKFIVGAGGIYALKATGGADTVRLTDDQVGKHYHRFGYHSNNNGGYFLTSSGSYAYAPLLSWMRAGTWNGSGGGGYNGWGGGSGTYFTPGQNLVTSLAVVPATRATHENRPPYYALYFIMKAKGSAAGGSSSGGDGETPGPTPGTPVPPPIPWE